ncbi:MAG: hypothetical protein A3H50_02375 [Candidatus Levybacteria bacterium RIFCSPLOWO2_02_FULL_37_10]|nr:MAG: hypothetical protein A2860_04520 [Candidatus Levybacteria bacterium RIFCSPHIGHO2_01_FULL_37_33]OGH29082.1 MAG: hypothetical protein A3F30_01265 [Candidatus Levybacteria bacterium RIFCSPHIGHO2_12_FULL_37_12]OGH33186.1 MAG: hypothetical protein A2953_02735 [Candidatus Levybacteria bacterium RIFCSPLOWO2_01_FULL_36_54]OGH46047.1 MAG: hypothetical protein A3H50_02375 [Candidatus Levybacteria bacterium RIFCSPLOWO2_02_FULL_37_10]
MKSKNYTLTTMPYSLTIGWLYPELMSTYGDRGNIIVLEKRCEWRGISAQVVNLDKGFNVKLFNDVDILFMGGAQDLQQKIVSDDFSKEKTKAFKKVMDWGLPGLYICGAYQFLGKYYKEANGNVIPGLGILDLRTEHPGEESERLIGNIVVEVDLVGLTPTTYEVEERKIEEKHIIVGFENHGGKTYLGENLKPFGQVMKGFGNNGKDKTEGAVYKNSIGTYLHGPILPKNPEIADWLIEKALERKYKKKIKLKKLDDFLSQKAKKVVLQKMSSY